MTPHLPKGLSISVSLFLWGAHQALPTEGKGARSWISPRSPSPKGTFHTGCWSATVPGRGPPRDAGGSTEPTWHTAKLCMQTLHRWHIIPHELGNAQMSSKEDLEQHLPKCPSLLHPAMGVDGTQPLTTRLTAGCLPVTAADLALFALLYQWFTLIQKDLFGFW